MENCKGLLCSRILKVTTPCGIESIVWVMSQRKKIVVKVKWSQIEESCRCLWTLPPLLSPSYGSFFYWFSFIWIHEAFKTSFMCKLKLGKLPIYGEVMAKFFQTLCKEIRPHFHLISKGSIDIRINTLDVRALPWGKEDS